MSGQPRSPELWESVPGGLWRLPVPGGWMYATEAPGHPGRAIAFVPTPPAAGIPAAAPLTMHEIFGGRTSTGTGGLR